MHIGLIAGIGPAATDFYYRGLIDRHVAGGIPLDLTMAHADVREMSRNLVGNDPKRQAEIFAGLALRLKAAGAEVLAMPCNTAHAHAAAIRAAGLPFVDMVAETAKAAAAGGAQRIGVLATPGGEALYAAALDAEGVEMVGLSEADRARFMAVVFGVKAGDTGPEQRTAMRELAAALVTAGAQGIIGGCTEVPLLLDAGDVAVPLTDSAEVLARVCVEACL